MKKVILLSISLIVLFVYQQPVIYAQGLGVNSLGNPADPSAILDASATNKGILIPRLTTAQRDAIVNPAEGLQIYNLDCHNLNYYNGTAWLAVNSLAASVSITASPSATIRSATTVTFSASPVNGGTAAYQWKVNGVNAGTNSNTYAYAPANNDVVTCVMTSGLTCGVTGSPATSNAITMTVNASSAASVSISASPSNSICSGNSVTFSATAVNGGSSPAYQWKINGNNVGANNSSYSSSSVNNGDQVTCVMTSSQPCATGSPATSNTITMTVQSGGSGTQTFAYTGSLQTFTVPCVSTLTIETWGAQGGGHTDNCGTMSTGGLGAYIKGTFSVTAGQQLNILVGGQGGAGQYTGGGGGGSFVWATGNTLLIAAGGGGGSTSNVVSSGAPGSATTTPTGGGGSGTGAGGSGGNGGSAGACNGYTNSGSGGAGWSSDGANNTCGATNTGGKSPLNGGVGGAASAANGGAAGGYGGGGGSAGNGASCGAGAGGGGYNGGGGGSGYTSSWGQGGGGGSFNGGTSQTNTAGNRSGNGQVKITW